MGRIIKNTEDLNHKTINISCLTIDALVSSGIPAPHIMKIDTEGEEGNILKGATRTLQAHRPSCLIEVHTPKAGEMCWDILNSFRYSIHFLSGTSLQKAKTPKDIYYTHLWAEPII